MTTLDNTCLDSWIKSKTTNNESTTIEFINGNKYIGSFQDNTITGNGEYIFNDDTSYTGPFKENVPFGEGIYKNKSNTISYKGNIINGLRNGFGILTINEPNFYRKYVGSFINGKRHGNGTLFYNKQHTIYYRGNWLNGNRHGFGLIIYQNCNKYIGNWENDKKYGKGTMIWKEKQEKYVGLWNNIPNGEGIYYYGNKNVKIDENNDKLNEDELKKINYYVGNFVDGKREGYGIYYYSNGDRYEGQWKNNLKHGNAKYIDKNGNVEECVFKDDYKL